MGEVKSKEDIVAKVKVKKMKKPKKMKNALKENKREKMCLRW